MQQRLAYEAKHNMGTDVLWESRQRDLVNEITTLALNMIGEEAETTGERCFTLRTGEFAGKAVKEFDYTDDNLGDIAKGAVLYSLQYGSGSIFVSMEEKVAEHKNRLNDKVKERLDDKLPMLQLKIDQLAHKWKVLNDPDPIDPSLADDPYIDPPYVLPEKAPYGKTRLEIECPVHGKLEHDFLNDFFGDEPGEVFTVYCPLCAREAMNAS